MDRGAQSTSQRPHRATVRDAAGSFGEGDAFGGNRHHRGGELFSGEAFSSRVGTALHSSTAPSTQCPSTTGKRTASGRNSERAGGAQGGPGSHGQLGGEPLGCAPRRSVCRTSRSASRDRTTVGWHTLAALPWPLSPVAPLPATGAARGKPFRPTAYRACRKSPFKKEPKCTPKPSLADISIWQKTGHFYFALTLRSQTLDEKCQWGETYCHAKAGCSFFLPREPPGA